MIIAYPYIIVVIVTEWQVSVIMYLMVFSHKTTDTVFFFQF